MELNVQDTVVTMEDILDQVYESGYTGNVEIESDSCYSRETLLRGKR